MAVAHPAHDFAAWRDQHRRPLENQQFEAAAAENRWSWARLLCFLAGITLWYPAIGTPWLAAGIFVAGMAAFGYAIRRHGRLRRAREALDRQLTMLREATQRDGGAVVLLRTGERPGQPENMIDVAPAAPAAPAWTLTDQERDDLDVFNPPVGLFGLLNRCSSSRGARRLRDMVEQPLLDPRTIEARQDAVRALASDHGGRLRLLAAAATFRTEDKRYEQFLRAVATVPPLRIGVPLALVRAWVIIGLLLIGWATYQTALGDLQWWALVGVVLFINFVAYAAMRGRLEECLEPLRNVAWGAQAIHRLAEQAAADLPAREATLGPLRERFVATLQPGVLPRLVRWLGWTESGGLGQLVFNGVFYYDLFVARACVQPIDRHRDELLAAAAAAAELEALLSLACFAAEEPVTCWPTFVAHRRLDIVGGRHPLLEPQRCVANDLALHDAQHLWIITGSNMAGKSTFLRMVGVNALLAQIGAPATAREMTLCPVRLMTDLRARDNLARDESYFLSEVRHLKRLLLPPTGEAPLLGLVDEPFRGTNSRDQTAASAAVVQHLLNSQHLILLATHDRELCDLADGRAARNVHFAENLDIDGLVFDYQLREGPAQTRNALRILEREGYPPNVVAAAHAWADSGEEVEGKQRAG